MNFSLPAFWLSLLIGLLVIGIIIRFSKSDSTHRLLLAALSLTLLGLESSLTLAVFLSVFSVTWFALRSFSRQTHTPRLLIGLVVSLQFLPLVFFKYGGFLTSQILSQPPGILSICKSSGNLNRVSKLRNDWSCGRHCFC